MPAAPATDTATDAEVDIVLVRRSQAGDTRAFDELVTKYRGKVYAMTYHLVHNEAEAWDLSQEAFIKAWRALPRFKGDSAFYTWLYRIAHNAVYDWLRRKKVQGEDEFDDARTDHAVAAGAQTVPRSAPAPDAAMGRAEVGERIRQAIETLSSTQREVVLLREVEGLSYEEIATATECSIGTVMSRLFYARKKLQEILHDLKP